MIKCPCCQQPWFDTERLRLLDSCLISPKGAVALTPREDEIVTFYMMRKPRPLFDLSERLGIDHACARTHVRNTNEKIRRLGWHLAHFDSGRGRDDVDYGLCEIIRNPDGSFVQTHEMKGPPALKPQWHHA